MGHCNGSSFGTNSHELADGNSMCTGDGSRPPSWWFTFPADSRLTGLA